MNTLGVKFFSWEKIQEVSGESLEVKEGDMIVAERENGSEAGKVVYLTDKSTSSALVATRVLTPDEVTSWNEANANQAEILNDCRDCVKKYGLAMKLVEANVSFDGSRLVIAFTAEARVDFRELVRDLMRHFQKRVRLQQIGSRDEARQKGGYGHCGQQVCCGRFLKDIKSISTEMAVNQDLAHRGSDRLSGLCGRLLCCLSYENDSYAEAGKFFPHKGDVVYDKKNKARGVVVDRRVLEGSVIIALEDDKRAEVQLTDLKIVKRNTPINATEK